MSEREEKLDEAWKTEQKTVKEGYNEILPDETVYLSGPMREEPEVGKEWREEIKEVYGDEFNFSDPYDSFDPNDGDIVTADNFEDSESQIIVSDLVEKDKNMIYGSDYIFVGLSDVISRGTCMEIIFAYHNDIPVFLWDREGEDNLSPWVVYHTVYRSDSVSEIFDVIKGWET